MRRLHIWHLFIRFLLFIYPRKLLVVFTYHRVVDRLSEREYLLNYDRGIDRRILKNQLEIIGRYFRFIDLDEFRSMINGSQKLSGHSSLITFDDADSEFAEQAFPILDKYGVPAVVFTPTAYVESDKKFWHVRLSEILDNVTEESWEGMAKLEGLPKEVRDFIGASSINSASEKRSTAVTMVNFLDKYPQKEIEGVLTILEGKIEAKSRTGIKCLTWLQQRELAQKGIEFESHSVNHYKLAELSLKEILQEMTDSRKELEKRLGKKITAICYPAGSYNENVLTAASEAGYKLGFITRPGFCNYPLLGNDRFALPRFTVVGSNNAEIEEFLGKELIKALFS